MSDELNVENGDIKFDEAVRRKLGSYVYALRDPRDRKIFYVGKAGGLESQGNERVFSHFSEAREALKFPNKKQSAKVRRILEIWNADEEPEWFIVRYALPDEGVQGATAHHVEAALIDLLEISQNGPALNIQRGSGVNEHGLLKSSDVAALAVEAVAPKTFTNRPIFIFPIQKAIAEERDVYSATNSTWKVSNRFRELDNSIAVGVANGISKGVFRICKWKEQGDGWGFEGTELANEDFVSELHPRNYLDVIQRAMGYWQRGNYLVVQFDGLGQCRFLRGSSNKDWFTL